MSKTLFSCIITRHQKEKYSDPFSGNVVHGRSLEIARQCLLSGYYNLLIDVCGDDNFPSIVVGYMELANRYVNIYHKFHSLFKVLHNI